MAPLAQILLGLLIGFLITHTRHDCLWYSYFGSPLANLKSKVTSQDRASAVSFYKSMLNPPVQFNWFFIICIALILLSLVGQIIQFPKKKLLHIFNLVCFSCAIFTYVFYTLPLMDVFKQKYVKIDLEASTLYSLSLWNSVTLGFLVLCAVNTISAQEDDQPVLSEKKSKSE